jgi:diguanylate cyclase (GGDEF)-like protein
LTDYESVLFWRRWASLGWGCMFSLQLHFFLILTEKKSLLSKKWFYLLLYMPCFLIIYVFGINSNMVREQYILVNTAFGWVQVFAGNFWNWYIIIYCIVFSTAGLWFLWRWSRIFKNPVKLKIVLLLITTYIMAMVLGALSEIFINSYASFYVPQLAPIFGLVPLAVIFFAIIRYGFMLPAEKHPSEPGVILSPDKLVKFRQIITIIFFVEGIICFASHYFLRGTNLSSALLNCAALIGLGIILQLSQQLPVNRDCKDTILFIILAASIPLITLQNIQNAGITVWAVPIVFIMLSVIYNKRRIMIWLGISIIFTQLWVWQESPQANILMDASDHLSRIIIFLVILGLAFYINRIYVQRLEENENQIQFQKMVSRLSAAFLCITYVNKEESMKELFNISADFFQMDLAYLISLSPEAQPYQWRNAGIEADHLGGLPDEDLAWVINLPWQNDLIHISNAELLPPEAAAAKIKLKQLNIKSLLAIKIQSKENINGFLLFASIKNKNIWRDEHIEMLKIIANLVCDALQKIESERKINKLAYYDSLTGLPNRTLFINRLELAIHLAKRSEKLIGVIFIDLDCFKGINDTLGHDGGDEILKQVASRLTRRLRKHDTITRFGGDEFLIQLTQMNCIEDIEKITAGILHELAQTVVAKNQHFYLTASAGVAIHPIDGEDAETLIKNADLAMYVSKNSGKNQYTMCSSDIKDDARNEMKLTNNLYRALERNEMVLEYQPQVSVLTKEFCGVEAFIRWKHPNMGMILPEKFIPLAEKTGLIHPIGEWVLETACRQNKQWQDLGLPPLCMTVNLSVEQLRKPDLVGLVAKVLKETGLDAKFLGVDINESIIFREPDYIIQVLNDLKKLGVSIAIEGFGTEYSSLGRLKELPIDQVKINMHFVQEISRGKDEEDIVKTIIQLAQNLQFNVLAEGVETDPQFDFFCQQRCNEIQGFNVFKPMPANELEAILLARSNLDHPINMQVSF